MTDRVDARTFMLSVTFLERSGREALVTISDHKTRLARPLGIPVEDLMALHAELGREIARRKEESLDRAVPLVFVVSHGMERSGAKP